MKLFLGLQLQFSAILMYHHGLASRATIAECCLTFLSQCLCRSATAFSTSWAWRRSSPATSKHHSSFARSVVRDWLPCSATSVRSTAETIQFSQLRAFSSGPLLKSSVTDFHSMAQPRASPMWRWTFHYSPECRCSLLAGSGRSTRISEWWSRCLSTRCSSLVDHRHCVDSRLLVQLPLKKAFREALALTGRREFIFGRHCLLIAISVTLATYLERISSTILETVRHLRWVSCAYNVDVTFSYKKLTFRKRKDRMRSRTGLPYCGTCPYRVQLLLSAVEAENWCHTACLPVRNRLWILVKRRRNWNKFKFFVDTRTIEFFDAASTFEKIVERILWNFF